MKTRTLSSKAETPATPELQHCINELFAGRSALETATLKDLRGILLGNEMFISDEGEIICRLDRTSLVIEVDTLIDRRGMEMPLSRLLVN